MARDANRPKNVWVRHERIACKHQFPILYITTQAIDRDAKWRFIGKTLFRDAPACLLYASPSYVDTERALSANHGAIHVLVVVMEAPGS